MKKLLALFTALLSLALATLAEAQTQKTPQTKTKTQVKAKTAKDYSDGVILGVGLGFAAFEFNEAKMKSALTYDLSYHKFFNKYLGAGLSAGYYEANSETFVRAVAELQYTVRAIHLGPKFLVRLPVKYNQMDIEPYAGVGIFYFLNKVKVSEDFDESGGALGAGLEAGLKIYRGDYLFGINAARYIDRQKFDGASSNLDRTDLKIILGVSF